MFSDFTGGVFTRWGVGRPTFTLQRKHERISRSGSDLWQCLPGASRWHSQRQWLLTRLSDSFVFKTSEPLDDNLATACLSFQVQYSSQMSGSKFATLLAAIPEVNLMSEPA